MTAVDVQPHVS